VVNVSITPLKIISTGLSLTLGVSLEKT